MKIKRENNEKKTKVIDEVVLEEEKNELEEDINASSKKNETEDIIDEGAVLEENKEVSKEEFYKSLVEELKLSNKKLSDENWKVTSEVNTLKERLTNTLAEYENFRKRTSKEKEELYTGACEDILKTVLPILDNIERAASIEGSLEDIKKGIDMTLRQFGESLSKLEVEEIETSGSFDPNLHNAVMHIEDDNFEKNQIVEVFQKGYKRGNKVLRYSMVKVAN